MAGKNGDLNNMHGNDYSLESILAEYKGTAYINGDKKTPPELLKEQADRIIMEAIGKTPPEPPPGPPPGPPPEPSPPPRPEPSPPPPPPPPPPRPEPSSPPLPEPSPPPPPPPPEPEREHRERGYAPDIYEAPPEPGMKGIAEEEQKARPSGETDKVLLFFDNYRSEDPEPHESIVRDVERAVEREISFGEAPERPEEEYFLTPDRYGPAEEEGFSADENFIQDEVFAEPDLRDAARRFEDAYKSVALRSVPAAMITLIMIILTFAFEAGKIIPFTIGRSESLAAGALVVSLLVVMMLSADLIVRGAVNLVRGTLNVETLILFSCTFSIISGAFMMVSNTTGMLPYCAVSALSLTSAFFGEKYHLRAITETLKTASASSEPYGVQAEYNADIKRSVLKKAYNRTDGFYNNLMHPDVTESTYRFATPVLLASALVLSIISALSGGQGQYFLHILSALLTAAAPFSAMLAFSLPFSIVARSLRKSGAAIAGWGGAEDVCSTDGACVSDNDLFPSGTLKINGHRLLGSSSMEKSFRYTASLILKSGSGLSGVFLEEINSRGWREFPVEDFAFHEAGGISGLVLGERVMTGSSAFMTLQHIDIPEEYNMSNAVFTTVNNELAVVFSVNYAPQRSVQNALMMILKWRIKLYFAVRDFNLTPVVLQKKFRISLEDIEFIQTRDSYSISDTNSGKEGRMSAVLIREGFGPFADAVTGGKLLRSSSSVAAVISVVSAAIGLLFMFYMCWSGAFMSAKPGNLLIFMMCMLAAVLIVCGYARLRK